MLKSLARCCQGCDAESLDLAHSRAATDTTAGAGRATHEVGDGGDSESSEAEPEEGGGSLCLTAAAFAVGGAVGHEVV